jgi:hypothetical protein
MDALTQFETALAQVSGQLRELAARTTAESLAMLSDEALAEECAHFAYLSNKLKQLGAALERNA